MPGVIFEDQAPRVESGANRMDIALFVGFVRLAAGAVISEDSPLFQWLDQRGWIGKPYGRPWQTLYDLPVPIENWPQFEALFDWQNRTADNRDGATYLGAAVRSFFAQGGRKCYVVRVGDPWPLQTSSGERLERIGALIPGHSGRLLPSPRDRRSWSGIGHVFGLPDVSFVCIPDLVDAVATDRTQIEVPAPVIVAPEEFVECSALEPEPPADRTVRDIGAPLCDESGFANWKRALQSAIDVISRAAYKVELIAAVPMPRGELAFDTAPPESRLQLAYPWMRTPGSAGLPAQLESPDGVLTGILAQNALMRGTYTSAANLHTGDAFDVFPVLDRHEQQDRRLIERVSIFGPTPDGLRLLSDVTMSEVEEQRPGSVNRLVATIVRAARELGEEVTFESSGERLWAEVEGRLDALMRGLWLEGIFNGTSPSEAYRVRCDATTMSQNDIDNGRVIAIAQFNAALPIDTITVVLIVNENTRIPTIEGEAA